MEQVFLQELKDSLYIHRPLPLHTESSLEAGFANKAVTDEKQLYNEATAISQPKSLGRGTLKATNGVITVTAPLRCTHWPEGAPLDGDYCNFGTVNVNFSFKAQNWQGYNRLRFDVKPRLFGARVAHLNVSIANTGKIALPDKYFREGATVFDLNNNIWNECIWEFNAMPRDAITQLSFYVFLSGQDIPTGPTLIYDYKNIRLEHVESPEHEHGWQRKDSEITLSTVGYWPNSVKTAIGSVFEESFSLVSAITKQTAFTALIKREQNARGTFAIYDFTDFNVVGKYFLRAGNTESCVFSIEPQLCTQSLWSLINFLYCERCGTPVQGKHGACHLDVTAEHKSAIMSFAGGWHDAGDVSQQAAQTAEAVHALFENAMRVNNNRMLYLRLMEEAQWGLDFVLRTRFGDGYRATSAGATRYTNNLIGDFDDIKARVHNHSYENFLFSGVEAYSAQCLKDYDKELSNGSLAAALADFDFALEQFKKTGVEPAHMFEHTYNSGLSQYYAVVSWAASCIYAVSQNERYAKIAREYATKLINCQEQGKAGLSIKGFFYRDESHSKIVHFNHQSREQQFMQALESVCRTQPHFEEKPLWENAMRLYACYIKAIAKNTSPYGMLPAGVHKLDEADDTDTFKWLHVTCNYDVERENYVEQLANATPVADGYVLRNFPVWFSFRGNTAVMLSMGKAASLVGRYFKDEQLLQIGREQLYWMWGKNPFAQSLIYGVGSNYCRQYAVLCGECVGEVPVGVETLNNEDVPYWPQNNNATFREVWIGAASRWLWLCADYIDE